VLKALILASKDAVSEKLLKMRIYDVTPSTFFVPTLGANKGKIYIFPGGGVLS